MENPNFYEPITDPRVIANIEFNRRHAVWASHRFQLLHPEVDAKLYHHSYDHCLVLSCPEEDFAALAKEFNHSIRPVTCQIRLALEAPQGMLISAPENDYAAELWQINDPLSVIDMNRLLCLATPALPSGWLSFDTTARVWCFSTLEPLPTDAEGRVRRGFASLQQPGHLLFDLNFAPKTFDSRTAHALGLDLFLQTSSEIKERPTFLQRLVERDEDEWRSFLNRRGRQRNVAVEHKAVPRQFSCLMDTSDASDVQLSELLTIYDRVEIIPRKIEAGNTLERLQVSEKDFAELAAMGKVRLVLPDPVAHYEPGLVQAVSEAREGAVILSRELAQFAIERGQRKDPLLYGPFSKDERIQLLKALMHQAGSHPLTTVLRSYSKTLDGQHYAFMNRGAGACLGFGVGSHIANVIEAIHGKDLKLELMIAGAHIEWSLALGASYLPVKLGEGFSLDKHAAVIASYLGRTTTVSNSPAADRIHTVVSGLLAPMGVPPLDVAKNLTSGAVSRFRLVAKKLMSSDYSVAELSLAIEQLNIEVRAYEGRQRYLNKWGIGALLLDASKEAAGASIFSLWCLDRLIERLPSSIRSELDSVVDTFKGLALSPSLDAVIVSRARGALGLTKI